MLDLGCGVGGPAREICRFSRANIVGVNNNEFQITRAKKLTAESGPFVAARCSFVQSDFMKLPFGDASHDHAYAIEATCHAPDAAACYREIARCIKPGGMFVCYEWVRPALLPAMARPASFWFPQQPPGPDHPFHPLCPLPHVANLQHVSTATSTPVQ